MNNKSLSFILSFGGVGHLPLMPGTFGSLAVIPFLILMSRYQLSKVTHIFILIILTAISTLLIKKYQETSEVHDASMIVVDEVLGMYTGWIFIKEPSTLYLISLFILFRIFDITKPWPASYFDKKISAFSVIADDLIAGIFSGIIIYIFSIFY